jgi:hypothetical protein
MTNLVTALERAVGGFERGVAAVGDDRVEPADAGHQIGRPGLVNHVLGEDRGRRPCRTGSPSPSLATGSKDPGLGDQDPLTTTFRFIEGCSVHVTQ